MTNIDFQTAREAISQTNYLNIVSELSFSFFHDPLITVGFVSCNSNIAHAKIHTRQSLKKY